MSDEGVLDASVVADYFFAGPGSTVALTVVRSETRWVAPDLIFAEFASVATKFVRRGMVLETAARDAVEQLPLLIDEVAPLIALAGPAYDLALRHSFSVYDAFYLALALRRGIPLVTADAKLARRAVDLGMANHVLLLSPES